MHDKIYTLIVYVVVGLVIALSPIVIKKNTRLTHNGRYLGLKISTRVDRWISAFLIILALVVSTRLLWWPKHNIAFYLSVYAAITSIITFVFMASDAKNKTRSSVKWYGMGLYLLAAIFMCFSTGFYENGNILRACLESFK